jgi:hypothetical protein
MREQRPATKSQHELKEWRALVRNAFGPALATLDLNETEVDSRKKLKKIIEAAIDIAPSAAASRFITVGCTLFDEPLPASLQIGSVLFQTKSDWLADAEMRNRITPKVRKRLARAFAGRRLAKPKDAWQDHNERSILRVLQSASHVWSRTLHGTNPEILHDWSDARGLAESLTRLCLVYTMDWLHSHPTATSGGDLLQP